MCEGKMALNVNAIVSQRCLPSFKYSMWIKGRGRREPGQQVLLISISVIPEADLCRLWGWMSAVCEPDIPLNPFAPQTSNSRILALPVKEWHWLLWHDKVRQCVGRFP